MSACCPNKTLKKQHLSSVFLCICNPAGNTLRLFSSGGPGHSSWCSLHRDSAQPWAAEGPWPCLQHSTAEDSRMSSNLMRFWVALGKKWSKWFYFSFVLTASTRLAAMLFSYHQPRESFHGFHGTPGFDLHEKDSFLPHSNAKLHGCVEQHIQIRCSLGNLQLSHF